MGAVRSRRCRAGVHHLDSIIPRLNELEGLARAAGGNWTPGRVGLAAQAWDDVLERAG